VFPVNTALQLQVTLKSLRKARGLTQAQLGEALGVSQKRIARIEANPEVTSFDQIARIVTTLGYRLTIEEPRVATPAVHEKAAW